MNKFYSDTFLKLIGILQVILLVIWLLMVLWGYDFILGIVYFLLPIFVLSFQESGKIKYGFLLIINLFIFGFFIFEILNIYFGVMALQSAMKGKALGGIRIPIQDIMLSFISFVIVLIVGLIPQIYILVKTIHFLKKQRENTTKNSI